LIGCVAGTLVLGWQVSEDQTITAPLYAILINLISPMLLGLCISTLRLACVELMRPDNRVGGTVSSVELTSIKLLMSSSVALILACFLEGGGEHSRHKESWWVAFFNLPNSTKLGVIGGAILIAVFQANCTFLCFLTNAVTVGLVGQVKIIPQWMTAVVFSTKVTNFIVKPTAVVGAFLICGSAAVFAFSNWMQWRTEEEEKVPDGSIMLLEVSDDTNSTGVHSGNNNIHAMNAPSSPTHPSIATRRGSCGEAKPSKLFADADHWGDASMLTSFHEDEATARSESLQPLLLNPPLSPRGNLSTR